MREIEQLRADLAKAEAKAASNAAMTRVANSRARSLLQTVGLILRRNGSREKTAPAPLRHAASNLLAIAAAHELLQKSDPEAPVRLDVYLVQLCAALEDFSGEPRIKVQPLSEAISLPSRLASPLGLFASEAVMNGLAYAGAGRIIVCLSRQASGRYVLSIGNDGHGRVAIQGAALMQACARQLGGSMRVAPTPGGGERLELSFTA
jgi:two-component sensor histidine kinase